MWRRPVPTDPSELLAFLRREESERRLNTKVTRWIAWSGFLFVLAAGLLKWARGGAMPDFTDLIPVLVLLGAASGVSGAHRRAAEVAAKLESPEFAPAMVEILDCREESLRKVAIESLRKSLPMVKGPASPFDDRQQRLLALEAMRQGDVDFAELCLVALGRFGGPKVLVELDQVAEGSFKAKGPSSERLLVAARMAAAEIRLRTARAVVGSTALQVDSSVQAESERLRLGS